jgi:LAO/AO transport system kinase
VIDVDNGGTGDFRVPQIDDFRTIGRLITEIERSGLKYDPELKMDPASAKQKKITVGVTGGSGVGKSTFINTLIGKALSEKHKVAVLAIDPMSELDKGTFLGDRLRFDSTYPERGVFIRSISSSAAEAQLPESLNSMLSLLGMIGYDFLIVETVGIGQADARVKRFIDKLVFIPSLDLVDWVQALKNEALINADLVFINDRGDNKVKPLFQSLSSILESRNPTTKKMLFNGNANSTLDLEEVYQFLAVPNR